MMVTLDLLEDHPLLSTKVVWSSAMVNSGVQCVMTPGMTQMPLWFVGSWDTLKQVCNNKYKFICIINSLNLGAQAVSFAAYGQGTGPILLDDVACAGTEARLIECRASPITIHNCVHFEDASVRCQAPPSACIVLNFVSCKKLN